MKKKIDKQKIAELEKKCYDLKVANSLLEGFASTNETEAEHWKKETEKLIQKIKELKDNLDYFKKCNEENYAKFLRESDKAIKTARKLEQMQDRVNDLVDKFCKPYK